MNSRSGFTLIELVISSALMAGILTSAYLCLRSGTSSQTLIESRADVLQSARVAMAMMSADLRCAWPLSKEFDFLGMNRMLGEVEGDNLDFATRNFTPRRPSESDWCEVSYFLEKDRESGEFSLWRRRDPTPDPEPLAGGNRDELARGLRGLRFEYYDGFEWFDEWGDPEGRRQGQVSVIDPGNLSGMPEAVRVTLWFEPNPDSKPEATSESDQTEIPMMFQTVVRLNLAAAARRGSSSGTSSGGSRNAAGPSAQGAPPGGNP